MDDAIKTAREKIKKLSAQNPEFDAAMRELFGTTTSASAVSVSSEDSRINEIYEYCIEKVNSQYVSLFLTLLKICAEWSDTNETTTLMISVSPHFSKLKTLSTGFVKDRSSSNYITQR